MKKRIWTKIYAILLVALLLAGLCLVAFFAWNSGTREGIDALAAIAISLLFAPALHEVGHVACANSADMRLEYVKIFCFRLQRKNGKLRFSLCSPFAPDQTQVCPKRGGDMKNRAKLYVLGGLIFEGAFTLIIASVATLLACFSINSFTLWGLLPYCAYLFLLNAAPLEYPSGKTDMLVYRGLQKGVPAEQNMLSAMEIQGRLYAGESYAEIDEALYFSAPQLCEDEPLFSIMLYLQYRYHLEKGETDKAADRIYRIVFAQEFLSDAEREKIAVELTYFYAINEDLERARACSQTCEEFLRSDEVLAKRALAAYCKAFGKEEAVAPLLAQAESLLEKEQNKGEAKAERILLSRLA